MKKFFPIFLVLFAAVAATMLVSCSSSDDDDYKVNEQVVSLSFEPNEDLLSLFDISVNYTDENGKEQTEKLTGKFSKTLTIRKFPASGAFKLVATVKSSIPDKGSFNPYLSYRYEKAGHIISNRISMVKTIYTTTELQQFSDKLNKFTWEWEFASNGVSMK